MNSLQTFTNRFAEIESGNPDLKQYRLRSLMGDMKEVYHIPLFKNEAFEQENARVMQLYRAVDKARKEVK